MADQKASPARKGAMAIDTDLVRELADLIATTGLTEIEVADGDRRVRVSRAAAAVAAAPLMAAAPAVAAPAAPATAAPAAPSGDTAPAGTTVRSPMVGTAYLASDPAAPPLVAVGDTVKVGDTLLIVEAMKVMNPITATVAGVVKAILVGNAEPVEYDQPLAIIG